MADIAPIPAVVAEPVPVPAINGEASHTITATGAGEAAAAKPQSQPPHASRTTRRSASTVIGSPITAANGAQSPIQPFALLSVEAPNGRVARVEAVSTDLVLEIRHFLLSCPETCEWTCYHLTHNGAVIGDYNEIGAYPQLCDGQSQTLKLVPELYDERAARAHVQRIRQIIASPPYHIQHSLLVTVEELQEKEKEKSKKKNKTKSNAGNTTTSALSQSLSLKEYHSHALSNGSVSEPPQLVRSIVYDAYNPPPGNRRLRGDLVYLLIETLEGHALHVTGAVDGWFLNRSTSTVFNPNADETPYRSQTLIELLRRASQLFASRFESALSRKVTLHPFAQAEISSLPLSWLSSSSLSVHRPDWNRSEDSALDTYGMELRGVTRDWNEEYQSYYELPVAHSDDTLRNDCHRHRVYSEFVSAARTGAIAVVNGQITAANPLDQPKHHVFIYNNIFFSFAVDTRDAYTHCGGDAVSRKHAGIDLHGIESLMEASVDGLHTLATCVVDYRGHRIVCQSIIPGIFHADRASKHLYGSMESGEIVDTASTSESDCVKETEELLKLLTVAGQFTHSKPHTVIDKTGHSHQLVSAVDTKGIIGSDHRQYVLDLMRTTPRDSNFKDNEVLYAVLRRELVTKYCRQQAMDALFPTSADSETGKESEQEREERQMRALLEKQSQSSAITNTDTAITSDSDINTQYLSAVESIQFNNDVLVPSPDPSHQMLPAEEIARDLPAIEAVGDYLVNTVLPSFVTRLSTLELSPIDGEDLVRMMHSHGINVRYLGSLTTLLASKQLGHVSLLTMLEMIVRSSKHLLFTQLRDLTPHSHKRVELWFHGQLIVKFLNGLFGAHSLGVNVSEQELSAALQVIALHREEKEKSLSMANVHDEAPKKKSTKSSKRAVVRLSDGTKAVDDPLAAVNLWQSVRETMQSKYRYECPASFPLTHEQKLALLRAVCRRCGIKLFAKEFDFNANTVFTLDDIDDLVPVVKKLTIPSSDAQSLLASAQAAYNQGHLSFAYQYLSDALNHHNIVYGAVHELTGEVHWMLGLVCYQAGDFTAAADFQQRAVIIYERCLGLDDARTVNAHMTLALFLHSTHATSAAIIHCQRSLYLLTLMTGGDHPDVAAANINLAMLYQSQGKAHEAVKLVERAVDITQKSLGDSHIQLGLCYHSLAVAQALVSQFRAAVDSEKRCKQILAAELSPQHSRVQQSHYWLEHFTALAVKAASTQSQTTPTPLSILPPQLSLASPFTWMNLHGGSAGSSKGRLSSDEVLALIENTARTEMRAVKFRNQLIQGNGAEREHDEDSEKSDTTADIDSGATMVSKPTKLATESAAQTATHINGGESATASVPVPTSQRVTPP